MRYTSRMSGSPEGVYERPELRHVREFLDEAKKVTGKRGFARGKVLVNGETQVLFVRTISSGLFPRYVAHAEATIREDASPNRNKEGDEVLMFQGLSVALHRHRRRKDLDITEAVSATHERLRDMSYIRTNRLFGKVSYLQGTYVRTAYGTLFRQTDKENISSPQGVEDASVLETLNNPTDRDVQYYTNILREARTREETIFKF